MIALGSYDPDLPESSLGEYFEKVRRVTGDSERKLRGDKGLVGPKEIPPGASLTVAGLQRFLRDTGFFAGGSVDGICGYGTLSAIRLFQEYVRSIEGARCVPDGIVGPKTEAHVRRWAEDGLRADWTATMERCAEGVLAPDSEFQVWRRFLEALKVEREAVSTPMLDLDKGFRGTTDTRKVTDWTFDPADIHLIGVRYGEQARRHKFDDLLVLMIKGLVFKFQASTDPGYTRNPNGAPFLVQGQHDFRFGLHRSSYHALRPLNFGSHGVLVVRSKGDFELTSRDIERGVEVNGTINVHWGGKGVGRGVNRWSEGCQVVAGSGYENHRDELVSCAPYVATNNTEVRKRNLNRTRGAYNVLSDLIVALSRDMSRPGEVKYTVVHEADLALDDEVAALAARTRQRARDFMGTLV